MRKLGLLVLVVMLVTVLPAGAQRSKARTESGEYNTLTITQSPGPALSGRISNAVIFEPRPGEKFVHIEIVDDAAENVAAVVEQDVDGDDVADLSVEICNATTDPIKITPGFELSVATQEGTCLDDSLSTPTYGTVTATFMAKKAGHQAHH